MIDLDLLCLETRRVPSLSCCSRDIKWATFCKEGHSWHCEKVKNFKLPSSSSPISFIIHLLVNAKNVQTISSLSVPGNGKTVVGNHRQANREPGADRVVLCENKLVMEGQQDKREDESNCAPSFGCALPNTLPVLIHSALVRFCSMPLTSAAGPGSCQGVKCKGGRNILVRKK